MTILWPIDPVSGHPLSIEIASTAVWVKAQQPPSPEFSDAEIVQASRQAASLKLWD